MISMKCIITKIDKHRRRRLLRVPWTARRSNQSMIKEISQSLQYSLGGLILKLKVQYFGHLRQRQDPKAGKDWRQEEKRMTEDEMVGWHHWLNGHEFEWTPGVGDGQGGLAFCSPWGHKESDTTEWLKWTDELYINKVVKNKPICFYSECKCLQLRLFIPTIDKYHVIKTSHITIVTTIGAQFYLKMAFETSISSTNPLQDNSLPAEPPGKPNVGRHHPNLMRATTE